MLDYGLQQRQVQRLVMTPKLRQSISILQMPAAELLAYVNQQLVENPALDPDSLGDDAANGEDDAANAVVEDSHDTGWHEYFADSSDLGYVRNSRGVAVEQTPQIEQPVPFVPTLCDSLMSQLGQAVSDPVMLRVGRYIIGNLDRDGYLRCSLDEIAQVCAVDIETVSRALRSVQDLEPAGVGARHLSECLAIQLRRRDIDDSLRKLSLRIVTRYLHELATMTQNQLARSLKTDVATCQLAIDLIRSLNPRPALTLDHVSDAAYVVPDVVVREIDGDFVVVMNEAATPRIGVNASFAELARDGSADARAVRFLRERLESALWLVRSIEQRRNTIYRITECIVRRQRDFLTSGTKALKPMTLRDIADELGVHESTVCRASAGKYVQTPRGTYELSFFFQSGVSNVEGEGISAEAVKTMISDLVLSEDPKHPLSDEALTKKLRRQGIMVSRRTVAKYRESMGIPSSMGRRRYVHQP